MSTDCSQQLTFWEMGTQQVTVDFQGGRVVTDTGLLPLRLLDKELGVLASIVPRLADPRAQKFVTHRREALLTQEVYQILAGYADGKDAQFVRQDPLFQTLVDVPPDDEQLLASGATLNRFHHAYTSIFRCSSSLGKRAFRWRPGCGRERCTPVVGRCRRCAASSGPCGPRGRTCSSWSGATRVWGCRRCTSAARPKGCCMCSVMPATRCSRTASRLGAQSGLTRRLSFDLVLADLEVEKLQPSGAPSGLLPFRVREDVELVLAECLEDGRLLASAQSPGRQDSPQG
jgi:hypothetical protein